MIAEKVDTRQIQSKRCIERFDHCPSLSVFMALPAPHQWLLQFENQIVPKITNRNADPHNRLPRIPNLLLTSQPLEKHPKHLPRRRPLPERTLVVVAVLLPFLFRHLRDFPRKLLIMRSPMDILTQLRHLCLALLAVPDLLFEPVKFIRLQSPEARNEAVSVGVLHSWRRRRCRWERRHRSRESLFELEAECQVEVWLQGLRFQEFPPLMGDDGVEVSRVGVRCRHLALSLSLPAFHGCLFLEFPGFKSCGIQDSKDSRIHRIFYKSMLVLKINSNEIYFRYFY